MKYCSIQLDMSQTEGSICSKPPRKVNLWTEIGWPIGSAVILLRPLHHWLIGHLSQIQPGQKILEVGAGYPLYKLYADKVGKNGLFVAADINPNIQKRAQKICYWFDRILGKDPIKNNNVTHPVIDATILPFPDNTFDLIIASNFTGNSYRYIKEAFRTLRPGGRVVSTWNELLSIPTETTEDVKIFEAVGFKNVTVKPGMPGSIVPGELWNWHITATKPSPSL